MMSIIEIRNKLRQFVMPEEGVKLRTMLKEYAERTYKPKYEILYLKYMNEYECSFDRNSAQSQNSPYVWTMFSIPSQHVMGDCIEECLDLAIEKEQRLLSKTT